MTQRQFGNVTIETVQGDITRQLDLGAIVNAANAELRIGGGVAGAIHRAAGPGLEKECIPLGPIRPGKAVISGGHNLPNAHVIHCLGPVYGRDEPSDQLLASCYRKALEAAQVALRTIRDAALTLEAVSLVRFVLFSDADLAVFDRVLKEL